MKLNKSQKGVIAIEFALGSIVLMLTTFVIFEFGFRIYAVNMTEYAVRETIRNTKIYEGHSINEQYDIRLKSVLENKGNIWSFLIDTSNFSLEGRYFESYDNFVLNIGHSGNGLSFNYDLAEIKVTYLYEPKFNIFGLSETAISRVMVLNLEHEGWINE